MGRGFESLLRYQSNQRLRHLRVPFHVASDLRQAPSNDKEYQRLLDSAGNSVRQACDMERDKLLALLRELPPDRTVIPA